MHDVVCGATSDCVAYSKQSSHLHESFAVLCVSVALRVFASPHFIIHIAHADVCVSPSDGVANLYSTLHLHDIVCGATLTASQTHSYTLHQHDDFVALRLLASQTYTCISHRIPLFMYVALASFEFVAAAVSSQSTEPMYGFPVNMFHTLSAEGSPIFLRTLCIPVFRLSAEGSPILPFKLRQLWSDCLF